MSQKLDIETHKHVSPMKGCIITGLATNNKWKRKLVHPMVIREAKRKAEFDSRTLRDHIIMIQSEFNKVKLSMNFKDTDGNFDDALYIDFAINFFHPKEEDGNNRV